MAIQQQRFANIQIEELFHEITHGNTQAALQLTYSLKVKENINQKVSSQSSRILQTCLHAACHKKSIQVARRLLDLGADPNIRDSFNSTALHNAAAEGNLEMVKLLIEYNASPCMKKGERDAVAMARLYGRTDVVEFLISQFEPCTHAAGGLYYCDNIGASGPIMEKEESHQFCLAVEQQCPEVQATPVKSVREDETLSLEAKSEASEMEQLKKQFKQLQAEMKQLKLQQPSSGKAKPNQTKGEVLKDRIRRRFEYIVENVNISDHLDFLFSENTISVEDYQKIESKSGGREKTRTLLLELQSRRASLWVFSFLESLKRHHATAEFAKELGN